MAADFYGPMTPELRRLVARAGHRAQLEVKRGSVQSGRTFSEAAMEELSLEVQLWVLSRIIRRWEQTSEPPTVVRVDLVVTVQ